MWYPLRMLLVTASLLSGLCLSAQDAPSKKEDDKRLFLVKSNLLSLAVKKPTFAIERVFHNNVGAEVSFVQGVFTNFFLTDFYQYQGILFRVKKYTDDFGFAELSPFWGGYVGTLWRDIHTSPREGWLGGAIARDFTANSLRAGGTLGLSYITKSRIVFESLTSLGYGRYLKLDKADPNTQGAGYIDMQLWLSAGYCF